MSKKQKRPGKVVPDNKIAMFWKCGKCGKEVQVPPTFYEWSGTPICTGEGPECEGDDMEYVETRLLD